MDERQKRLFERMRERCHQQRWYGPDMHNPFQFIEREREQRAREDENYSSLASGSLVFHTKSTHFWYARNRNHYEVSEGTDLSHFPLQTDFEYPPATEEQLAASEEVLGYTLSPLLRALYATVANGGFGPGYGLYGVIGGFQDNIDTNFHRDTDPINHENDRHGKESTRETNLWMYGSLEYREIPFGKWPNSLYTLCHWGCGICSYLDCLSERVYRGDVGYDVHILRCEATSLDEWLDLWAKWI